MSIGEYKGISNVVCRLLNKPAMGIAASLAMCLAKVDGYFDCALCIGGGSANRYNQIREA